MRPAPALTAMTVLAVAACQNTLEAPPPAMDMSPPPANTHRGGDIAIREEFDAARHAGTLAAWDLFLARHPQHALAVEARRARERLARAARPE